MWLNQPIQSILGALFWHPLLSLVVLCPILTILSKPLFKLYMGKGMGMWFISLWVFSLSWLLHILADITKLGF